MGEYKKLALILLILLIIVPIVYPASSESASLSEWRMFHKTLNHTGVYPSSVNRHNFSLLWNYTAGRDVLSSPAIANDVLYIGSNDHNTYALNATNGNKI